MIAVKFIQGLNYPEKIRKNVDSLPQGYDQLVTQAEYDQLIVDNTAAYTQWKQDLADAQADAQEAQKFVILEQKWEEMARSLAVKNIKSGITVAGKSKQVADSFRDVVYYLQVKTPTEALAALQAIQPIPNFLPQETLDQLAADFQALLLELWPQS